MSQYTSEQIKIGKFEIVILGNEENEKYFLKLFPILLDNSKHKFLNRFDLYLKDKIKFPEDFINNYYSELIDRLMNIDILILTYNSSNKISFEYLKTFYYLYYNNFEEKDKPKNIILIDFGYTSKDIDKNSSEALKKLFNGNFYIHRDNEDKLDKILKECIENLKNIYNYTEYFDFFNNIKLNNFFVLVYGDKEMQNNFINLLFENCNLENKKILENIYEVKFNKIINGDNLNFKIRFKLMESGSSCYNSICNILLYDTNNKNS